MSNEAQGSPSRRALLAAGLGALGATVVSAVGIVEPAAAASTILLGATNTGTTTTTIRNSRHGTAVAVFGRLTHRDSSSDSAAIKGQDDGTDGVGVFGTANHGEDARGVYGLSDDGAGVFGLSANHIGVYGSGADYSFYAGAGADYGFYGSGNVSGREPLRRGLGRLRRRHHLWRRGHRGSGSRARCMASMATPRRRAPPATASTAWATVRVSSAAPRTRGCGAATSMLRPDYGVVGYGATYGIWGQAAPGGYAIWADGDVNVNGTISKAAGTFRIDHPLDPERKWLSHSFVESPDMKNVYDGIATAGSDGTVTVTLPKYFDALNRDFRYQLTALGGPAPSLHIAREIRTRSFGIAGASAGQRVSWQVTGIRQDDYANAHRVKVETSKSAADRGTRAFVPKGSAAKRMATGPRHVTEHPAVRPRSRELRPRQP